MQFFILKNFAIPFLNEYVVTAFIYPLVIIILPIKTSKSFVVTLAFTLGLLTDFFYDSPGVHAASLVLIAYIRSFVLKILEPRGGYRTEDVPSIRNYGLSWFMTYAGILLFVHLFVYFSIDAFTFVYIDKIVVNTLLSFVVSYFLILFYQIFIKA